MRFEMQRCSIPDVLVLKHPRFEDHRGLLSVAYSRRALAEHGVDVDFVQENESVSRDCGTVRGLHFQIPPASQAKLIRVVHGAVMDVAVDLRRGSQTFGTVVALELRAADQRMLFIPEGCAHGFCTLDRNTHIIYKLSSYYAPELERGLRWNDPDLAIPWPVDAEQAVVSDRDQQWPCFADFESPFPKAFIGQSA